MDWNIDQHDLITFFQDICKIFQNPYLRLKLIKRGTDHVLCILYIYIYPNPSLTLTLT